MLAFIEPLLAAISLGEIVIGLSGWAIRFQLTIFFARPRLRKLGKCTTARKAPRSRGDVRDYKCMRLRSVFDSLEEFLLPHM